jgi:hypothetical protein
VVGAAVASWVLSHAVRVVTDSGPASLIVNLAIVGLIGWLGITFFAPSCAMVNRRRARTRVRGERPCSRQDECVRPIGRSRGRCG